MVVPIRRSEADSGWPAWGTFMTTVMAMWGGCLNVVSPVPCMVTVPLAELIDMCMANFALPVLVVFCAAASSVLALALPDGGWFEVDELLPCPQPAATEAASATA